MGNGIKPASILLDRKRKEFYIEGSRTSARHCEIIDNIVDVCYYVHS